MKLTERIIAYGAIIVLAFLLFKACNSNAGETITVKNPEVKGSVSSDKIESVPIVGPSQDLSRTTENKGANNKKPLKNGELGPSADRPDQTAANTYLNQQLLAERDARIETYKNSNDSLRAELYAKAIQPKDVFSTLEDSIVKINFSGKVTGELKSIKLDYVRKAFDTKVQLKQYKLLGGVNLGSNIQLDKISVTPQLHYLNASGVMYSAGKDLMCKDCFSAGVSTVIFKYNRQVK